MIGTAAKIATWAISMIERDPEAMFDVKPHKEKRSRSQNSYYWALLYKTAKATRIPQSVLHNTMLRDYSRPVMIGGQPVRAYIPDNDEGERRTLENEFVHMKPTSRTEVRDGTRYRIYVLLKGSHEMTTDEFSYLLEGMVQEAKQQGIETLTPRELEELRQYEIQKQKKSGNRH